MNKLVHWFAERSLRERRLLLAMAGLLIVTIVWGLGIRPIDNALSSTRERHAAAVIRLGRTAAAVGALRTATRIARPPLSGTLADVVRARAEEAGLPLASVEPDGADALRISIPSARGAVLVAWLARLERAGIIVSGATLTDNGDRTVAARLTFREAAT